MLKIWMEPSNAKTNSSSIFRRRKEVEEKFDSIRFPTSPYRVPRYLHHFKQFKASELRICLLMGYK